jgi:hypothetical protein
MSMRPPVDKPRIDDFLRRLGETHRAGRVFLVGGWALVYQGLRARTLDVDITIEADDADALMQGIRRLKDELQINVELTSPADFVPLPPGWHDRSRRGGRYDALDVYCFDFYSIALSKIVRANQRDVDDIVLLAQHGLIEVTALDGVVRDALPQLGTGHYFNIDPALVEANYAAIRQLIAPA